MLKWICYAIYLVNSKKLWRIYVTILLKFEVPLLCVLFQILVPEIN